MKRTHPAHDTVDASQAWNVQRPDFPGLTRAERHALSRSTPLSPSEFRALSRGAGRRAAASRAR